MIEDPVTFSESKPYFKSSEYFKFSEKESVQSVRMIIFDI